MSLNFGGDGDSEAHAYPYPPPPKRPRIAPVKEVYRVPRPATSVLGNFVYKDVLLPKTEYEYDPLSKDHIRLLELKRGSGNEDIECNLISRELPRHGQPEYCYEALSYVWGDDNPSKYIRILDAKPRRKLTISDIQAPVMEQRSPRSPNTAKPSKLRDLTLKVIEKEVKGKIKDADVRSKKFYVRANLYAALQELRRKDWDTLLWVDSICVNQADPKEKTEQLARMHDIYNRAYNVCIWLGEAYKDGKSDRAMDFVDRVIELRLLDGLVSLDDVTPLPDRAYEWSCLVELMSASWFTRRWVVQEVALARDASIHCGSKVHNWFNFADAVAHFVTRLDDIRALYKKINSSSYNPEDLNFVEFLGAKVMVATTINLFRKSDNGDILERLLPLETLVSTLVQFDATNPRDIIYALLSLAKDSPFVANASRRSRIAEIRHLLEPAYGKHPVRVYADFITHCITSGSLDIICRHWAVPVREESTVVSSRFLPRVRLPSWIGLLQNSPFGPPNKLTGRVNGDSFVGYPPQRHYNACDNEPPQAFIEIIDNRQPVEETNAATRPTFGGSTGPDAPPNNPMSRATSATLAELPADISLRCKGIILGQIHQLSARMGNATIPRECLEMAGWIRNENQELPYRVPEQLWRTLVADRAPGGGNPEEWYRRACSYCLATTSPSGDINTGELIRNADSPKLMVQYLKRVQSVVWSRLMLKGPGIFGLAPGHATVGDVVCILFGCSVPVVLRSCTEYPVVIGNFLPSVPRDYELVGEAYIHGKMDGEALAELSQEELDEGTVEFVLR